LNVGIIPSIFLTGVAALPLGPHTAFAPGNAISAHTRYPSLFFLLASRQTISSQIKLKLRTRTLSLPKGPDLRADCDASSHKSAYLAENIDVT